MLAISFVEWECCFFGAQKYLVTFPPKYHVTLASLFMPCSDTDFIWSALISILHSAGLRNDVSGEMEAFFGAISSWQMCVCVWLIKGQIINSRLSCICQQILSTSFTSSQFVVQLTWLSPKDFHAALTLMNYIEYMHNDIHMCHYDRPMRAK